jgi:hypothetical protein
LATTIDARVHCAVLKIRAVPVRAPPHPRRGGPVQGMAQRPFPQDPTACSTRPLPPPPFQSLGTVLTGLSNGSGRITSAPQMSCHLGTFARDMALDAISVETAPAAP